MYIEALSYLRSTLYTVRIYTKATGGYRSWRLQSSTQLSVLLEHLRQQSLDLGLSIRYQLLTIVSRHFPSNHAPRQFPRTHLQGLHFL